MSNQISELKELIQTIQASGLAKVKIKTDAFTIEVQRELKPSLLTAPLAPTSIPVSSNIPSSTTGNLAQSISDAPKLETTVAQQIGAKTVTIKSPMIGTFYRKPGPDKPLFVEVGSVIKKGQVICIIEAMKLFNEIQSEVDGVVVKVLIDDNAAVQYDQDLFLIEPQQ